jgi:hypothetical protein
VNRLNIRTIDATSLLKVALISVGGGGTVLLSTISKIGFFDSTLNKLIDGPDRVTDTT